MDFEEFLLAMGISEAKIDEVRSCMKEGIPVPDALHQQLLEYLGEYMMPGGYAEDSAE